MDFQFAQEKEESQKSQLDSWKILIADDEEDVHTMTKLALKKFSFEDRGLEFFHAYNGKETVEILKKNPEINLLLLDVVMDSDDDGLLTVKKIREELQNTTLRIVLRTGQPGSAPEKDVIINYGIDDYKEKTELTSIKLLTTVIASLRTSHHLHTIERNRVGLSKIIEASRSVFKVRSILKFTSGVLTQLTSILNISKSSLYQYNTGDSFFASLNNNQFRMIASTGKYSVKRKDTNIVPEALEYLNRAYLNKESYFDDDIYVGYFESNDNNIIFLYMEGCRNLDSEDRNFLEIFMHNISVAFDNICLNNEIIDTQKEIIERLGEVVENRSKEAAFHVKRVAQMSYMLAKASGVEEHEAYKFKLASPMHDIGKIGIPDSILLKPGKLTHDEFEIMKTHAQIGHDMLAGSKKELLRIARTVAYEHHEKWDGSGYPQGLSGEDISLYGRITAVVDVFDALTQKRVYKEAWSIDRTIELIISEKGKHFDPKLVDLLLNNIDEVKIIMSELSAYKE